MIIPFTQECYTHITDDDYRPLPEDKSMDIERDIDSVVEAHRAADVDALVDSCGDAQWQRDDVPGAKLPPVPQALPNLPDLLLSPGTSWSPSGLLLASFWPLFGHLLTSCYPSSPRPPSPLAGFLVAPLRRTLSEGATSRPAGIVPVAVGRGEPRSTPAGLPWRDDRANA